MDFSGMLSNILGNTDLMSIATEISKDLQGETLDPMALMSAMMSGKPNPQLSKLVQDISTKIEGKISSGELDQQRLEEQATSIMNAVETTDLAAQLPSLLKNMKM